MNAETIEQKEKKVETDVKEAKKRVAKRKIVKGSSAIAEPVADGLKESSNHAKGVLPELAKDKKPPEAKPKPKKKEPKVVTPAEWLQKYTKEGEMTTSGAKLVTHLIAQPQGCDLKTLIKRASEIAVLKGSSWGTSKTHIKSHLNFLKAKNLKVEEVKEDHFRLSV